DARFVYRRVPSAQLTRDEIIRRYAAHWNRRDAHAVASLFSENGLLIEPFTRSSDGAPVRHEGRADIEGWFSRAFASTPWLALQLSQIETLNDRGEALAVWRYADARLSAPLAGRNLFLLAGGEIFTSEVQLLAEPAPRVPGAAAMSTPLPP
ncbi:MAG TPA: nuclear transport factor 2 family protein, partial [Polyangiales bacterium]|nr:nuclear transport factor 2 family protein [Polyangiales bacterium]